VSAAAAEWNRKKKGTSAQVEIDAKKAAIVSTVRGNCSKVVIQKGFQKEGVRRHGEANSS